MKIFNFDKTGLYVDRYVHSLKYIFSKSRSITKGLIYAFRFIHILGSYKSVVREGRERGVDVVGLAKGTRRSNGDIELAPSVPLTSSGPPQKRLRRRLAGVISPGIKFLPASAFCAAGGRSLQRAVDIFYTAAAAARIPSRDRRSSTAGEWRGMAGEQRQTAGSVVSPP